MAVSHFSVVLVALKEEYSPASSSGKLMLPKATEAAKTTMTPRKVIQSTIWYSAMSLRVYITPVVAGLGPDAESLVANSLRLTDVSWAPDSTPRVPVFFRYTISWSFPPSTVRHSDRIAGTAMLSTRVSDTNSGDLLPPM